MKRAIDFPTENPAAVAAAAAATGRSFYVLGDDTAADVTHVYQHARAATLRDARGACPEAYVRHPGDADV